MDIKYINNELRYVSKAISGIDLMTLLEKIAFGVDNLAGISREDQLVLGAILGSLLHKSYCDGRRLDEEKAKALNLKNEPRVKLLNQELDKFFIEDVLSGKIPQSKTLVVSEGFVKLDIANTPFTELSPYWQYDNFMAGSAAIRSIVTNWAGLSNDNGEIRKYVEVGVANAIHEAWIARGNVYEDASNTNKQLETAYINLPEAEKDKDLKHFVMAKDLVLQVTKLMKNKPAKNDETNKEEK